MATIKIKFKDTITMPSSATTFNITFTTPENSDEYNKMIVNYNNEGGINYYYNSSVTAVYNSSGWRSYVYKVIEIDTTQANFNTFITAMKSNIEGVELESGTYQWVGSPENPNTCNTNLNFTSNNENFTGIKVYEGAVYLLAYINNGTSIDVFNYDDWDWKQGTAYRTITTTSNQYIDYDFYNYAILGNQLVKQATEITYTCKWYLDGTLVNTSTFTHEQLTGVDYNVVGSVFKVMLSASVLAQYDYGVNLNGETSNASLGSNNVITIEAFKSNIVFNITSNGTTTLATKNTYVPSDIDFNVNVPSVPLQEKSEYITSNTQTIITPDTGKALSKVTITTDVPQMIEVATSAEMDAKLNENNVSLYYKYTGTTDDKYTNGDIYQVQEG